MLAAILEGLVYIVLEFIVEVAVELLSEVGFNSIENARKSKRFAPVLRVVSYLIVGVSLGIASFFVIPIHFLQNEPLRIAGMILSPIALGSTMCLVSWFVSRKDRNEPLWSTEKFIQGLVFGAAYSITRASVV